MATTYKAKQLHHDSPASEFKEFYYGYYVEEIRTHRKHTFEIVPMLHIIGNEGYHGTTLPIDKETLEEVTIIPQRNYTGYYEAYCVEDDVFIFKGMADKQN